MTSGNKIKLLNQNILSNQNNKTINQSDKKSGRLGLSYPENAPTFRVNPFPLFEWVCPRKKRIVSFSRKVYPTLSVAKILVFCNKTFHNLTILQSKNRNTIVSISLPESGRKNKGFHHLLLHFSRRALFKGICTSPPFPTILEIKFSKPTRVYILANHRYS